MSGAHPNDTSVCRPRLQDGRIPLLVPYARREEARRLGARWHPEAKTWSVADDAAAGVPREMLPIRDRSGLEPPYIRINLVPQTSWGRNLRAVMSEDAWREFKRRHVYATTGSLCLVCGGRGPAHPVEADEVWHYDDDAGVQRLAAVVPLCPACHEVRSAGYATSQGRGRDAARHLAWVERITEAQAARRIDEALRVWERRSHRQWKIDLSLMERRYGLTLEHDRQETDEVNHALVVEAARNAARRGRSHRHGRGISADAAVRHLFGGTP